MEEDEEEKENEVKPDNKKNEIKEEKIDLSQLNNFIKMLPAAGSKASFPAIPLTFGTKECKTIFRDGRAIHYFDIDISRIINLDANEVYRTLVNHQNFLDNRTNGINTQDIFNTNNINALYPNGKITVYCYYDDETDNVNVFSYLTNENFKESKYAAEDLFRLLLIGSVFGWKTISGGFGLLDDEDNKEQLAIYAQFKLQVNPESKNPEAPEWDTSSLKKFVWDTFFPQCIYWKRAVELYRCF